MGRRSGRLTVALFCAKTVQIVFNSIHRVFGSYKVFQSNLSN